MEMYRELQKRAATNATTFHDHRLDIVIGCVYVAISVVGSLINLLVLCIFIRLYKNAHHGNNIIQGMLALVDLCNCSLSLPYTSYGLLSDRVPQLGGIWKDISGFVFNTSSRATILLMTLIAAYRLAMFAAPIGSPMANKALKPRVILTLSGCTILLCTFVSCVPLIWGRGYTWFPNLGFSGWQIEGISSDMETIQILSSVLILSLAIIPVFITIILSLVSVILLRKHSARMKTMLNSNTINHTKSNSYKAINTLKYLLFTYTACYSGWIFSFVNYYIFVMSGNRINLLNKLQLPPMGQVYLFTVSLLLVNANALINPILVLSRGKGVKETFTSFVRRGTRRRGRREPPAQLVKMTVINMVDLPYELTHKMRESSGSTLRVSQGFDNLSLLGETAQ